MTRVRDRRTGEGFEEQIFGGTALRLGYENPIGRRLVAPAFVQRWLSRLVGWYQSTRRSARAIPDFIRTYDIVTTDFAEPTGGYRSFNDFFARPLASGARPFPEDPTRMGAAAEGRLTVFELTELHVPLVIKGRALALEQLLASSELARSHVGGHAFVYRLCPVDYHRFHFPDSGRPGPAVSHGHALHSVHPIAHHHVPNVFLVNERQLCVFESDHFGRLILIEVGAMCVGRIVQSYTPGEPVSAGQEKGHFAFGGSSTIVLTEPGRVTPDADLLEATRSGVEMLVRVGETVAHTTRA